MITAATWRPICMRSPSTKTSTVGTCASPFLVRRTVRRKLGAPTLDQVCLCLRVSTTWIPLDLSLATTCAKGFRYSAAG